MIYRGGTTTVFILRRSAPKMRPGVRETKGEEGNGANQLSRVQESGIVNRILVSEMRGTHRGFDGCGHTPHDNSTHEQTTQDAGRLLRVDLLDRSNLVHLRHCRCITRQRIRRCTRSPRNYHFDRGCVGNHHETPNLVASQIGNLSTSGWSVFFSRGGQKIRSSVTSGGICLSFLKRNIFSMSGRLLPALFRPLFLS